MAFGLSKLSGMLKSPTSGFAVDEFRKRQIQEGKQGLLPNTVPNASLGGFLGMLPNTEIPIPRPNPQIQRRIAALDEAPNEKNLLTGIFNPSRLNSRIFFR